MKRMLGVGSVAIGLVMLALSSPAMAVPVVDFGGANITFTGGTAAAPTVITFGNASVSSAILFGASVTLTGPFSITPGLIPGCGASCYAVGGLGTFTVNGGDPLNTLSGAIDLVNISQGGTAFGTNYGGVANLTVVTATGVFAPYSTAGIVTTSFQFIGEPNLLNTMALLGFTEVRGAAYSGVVAPVPEPSSLLLLGAGLMGLAAYGRKKMMKG